MLFSDAVKEVTKAMAKPALNFLADNPELGYDMIAGGVALKKRTTSAGSILTRMASKEESKLSSERKYDLLL
ncbi:MAG: hypothetical protein IPQ26_10580 [Elusimicrobia bacterium]|nr:hypothetical protein [Elusimicrobiota bacterium]